jgi:RimJ/RimL family protein N-acetyltransferase
MAIVEREIVLSQGDKLLVRSARAGDGDVFLDYLDEVAGESDNLTFGSGEKELFTNEDAYMESIANSPNALFLLAIVGNSIIGGLTFSSDSRPKLSRSGEFGISVRKTWWGKGIGAALLQVLVDWAPTVRIGKINLQVRVDNIRAIALYRRFGFVDEAVIRHQIAIGGMYHDLLWMGLKIGADSPLDVPVPYIEQPPAPLRLPVHIRKARPEDAGEILACLQKISQETEFLSMGIEGPRYTLEEQRAFLVSAQNDPGSLYLIAFRDEQVVGLLSFSAGKRKRISHAGEFTLAILQDWGGMGIGKAMLHRLISWSHANGIHKINLEVRTENKRAVDLYLSCGFIIEGLITRTVFYNGGYHDSYAMGLIVGQQA